MRSLRSALMPVAATLAIQALMSMATVTLPVLAPAAASEIGAPVAWLGLFVALVYGSSMACGLASGALVRRLGALRLSQLCLLSGGAGVALIATGRLVWVVCGALLLGCGYGPVTPASSHLLTRTAPPEHLSMIFSIKQTGVPLGGVLAGSPLPLIACCGRAGTRRHCASLWPAPCWPWPCNRCAPRSMPIARRARASASAAWRCRRAWSSPIAPAARSL